MAGIVTPSVQVRKLRSKEVTWLIWDQTSPKSRTRDGTRVSRTLRPRVLTSYTRDPFQNQPHVVSSRDSGCTYTAKKVHSGAKGFRKRQRNRAEKEACTSWKNLKGAASAVTMTIHKGFKPSLLGVFLAPLLHCFLKEHLLGLRQRCHYYLSTHLHHEVNFSVISLNITGLRNF